MKHEEALKGMKDVTFDNAVYFDCDDTLIMWNYDQKFEGQTVEIIDEYGINNRVLPHLFHIEQVKKHFNAGHKVYIWSQGGEDWARKVTSALGLEGYVTDMLCKPEIYYDDKWSHSFLGEPMYYDLYTGKPNIPQNTSKEKQDQNELIRKFFTGWKQNRSDIKMLQDALGEISVLAGFTSEGARDAIIDVINKAYDKIGESNE